MPLCNSLGPLCRVAARGFVSSQMVKGLVVAAVVLAVGAWFYNFTHPPAVSELRAKTVDGWAVMLDAKPLTVLGVVSITEFGDVALGGDHWVVVTHDNAAGRFVQVDVKLSRSFLSSHRQGGGDKLSLSPANIKLSGSDGQSVEPLFLAGKFKQSPVKLNMQRFTERDGLPFDFPALAPWRSEGQVAGELKPVFRIDGVLQQVEGARTFTTPSGLSVKLGGTDTHMSTIGWGDGSTGWRALRQLDEVTDPLGAWGDWQVTMLFPKPAASGPMTLFVHNTPAKTFTVP